MARRRKHDPDDHEGVSREEELAFDRAAGCEFPENDPPLRDE